MSVFDDVSRFLQMRLDEFLKNNPHLEFQALDEQLREQEEDTLRLILDLQKKEKAVKDQILGTATDIQRWHERIQKAQAGNRQDLVKAAQERESALLRQGNQLWGQMKGFQERMVKAKELYKQVHTSRQELKRKMAEVSASRAAQKAQESAQDAGWNVNTKKYSFSSGPDSLEQEFKNWEAEEELNNMKRNMEK
ncbi:TIGR04376 family protein [Ancylothrix sp. C2]|uniref:TIGR04376 family protein n=1 Tax=Ancylothrix sp. D3o TaxID=2953691 RepID=UPI0021BAB697|nr:TIGR04376 family protein [Ancylothrix sp. D3o]MCT7950568.1 TIGR04376 family protein [Ancylothrix sp. D3o]